jgi:hypothetical protein
LPESKFGTQSVSASFCCSASAHKKPENNWVIKMDLRDDFSPVEEKTAARLAPCEDF